MPSNDPIRMLKDDHARVKKLLKELESTTERGVAKRQKLLQQIEQEVKIHTQIEEEIFYPAYREAAAKKEDKKLYFEAVEEHHVVDMVMPEIDETDPASEEFAAKAKVLKELIEHHAEEEEAEMFPRARKALDKEELDDLADRMRQRKSELQREMRAR